MTQNVLSLFSGAGGAVEGFKQAGYNVVAAVDFDDDCIETLEANHPDVAVIQEDLSETDPSEFAEKHGVSPDGIDVVVGGPPCKDFSKAQQNRTTDSDRASLVFQFAEYVQHYSPETFVMENVDALTTIDDGDFFVDLVSSFESGQAAEYTVAHDVLGAEKYGVPQKRKRTIVVGKEDGEPQLPAPTTPDPPTVSDAIDDLPPLSAGEEADIPDHNAINHRSDTVDKLADAEHGQAKHPAYARAYPDEPAFTIVGGNGSPPVHHEQPRRLTVRECARIQTFPDEYVFTGGRTRKYQMVGNAMPVKLAEAVAKSL